jgi:hypothetical protein
MARAEMTATRFRLLVAAGVVLTIVCLGVGSLAGRAPSCATGTVVELELARTEARATDLIGPCDERGLDTLRDGLRADNLGFVPLYIAAVGFWSLLGGSVLAWASPSRRHVVRAAGVAIVLAGGFDLVENHFLNHVVDAAGASPDIGPASAASIVKWVLVLVAVPIALVSMVRCVRAAASPEGRLASAPD